MSITRTLNSKSLYKRKLTTDGYVSLDYDLSIDCTGTRICQNVPGYREKIRNGSNATGPYYLLATKVEVLTPGSATSSSNAKAVPFPPGTPNPSSTEVFTGFATNISPPGTGSTSASKAEAIALAQIYRKIRSEQERMNSLASLAEITDVFRQFGAPANALIDLTNKRLNRLELERRGLKGTVSFKRAQWLRIVASTYLEWSFGLAPIISDTMKAAEALARFNNDEELSKLLPRRKVTGRGIDRAVSTNTNITNIGSSLMRMSRTETDTYESRCQYIAGLSAPITADFGSNERLMELLGVNPRNLIPAVWEAVPWSWLADYFSNVGEILNAAATSTASVNWVCKTVTSKSTREGFEDLNVAATNKALDAAGKKSTGSSSETAHYKVVRTELTRTIVTNGLGCPPLMFQIPTKPGQLANMVAVLFARKAKSSALWLF